MHTRWREGIAVLLATASMALAGWEKGATLPRLDGYGLEGELPVLAGRVVLLDFWASWCGPCKESFPTLDAFQREFGGKGLTVLAVSEDESAADMKEFLSARTATFPVVRDAGHRLVEQAGIEAMPTSVLIGRDGTIRFLHRGFLRGKTEPLLRAEIESLLAEPGPGG